MGASSTYLFDKSISPHQPNLTSKLQFLKLRRDVASFSIFYKYYFDRWSEEFSYCVPDTKNGERNTRLATSSQEFCVLVGYSCIDQYCSCFFPYIGNLWNSLPSSFFHSSYNLSLFKCLVYWHLRGIDSFFVSFIVDFNFIFIGLYIIFQFFNWAIEPCFGINETGFVLHSIKKCVCVYTMIIDCISK